MNHIYHFQIPGTSLMSCLEISSDPRDERENQLIHNQKYILAFV